ncbi:MAG: hypothetical protein NXI01_08860 [Gammaproteobacteria bacterium]|nr:hypothetical protein [Gammaproteobacteria bacterium]
MIPSSNQQPFSTHDATPPKIVDQKLLLDLENLKEINQVHVKNIQSLLTENRRLAQLAEDLMANSEFGSIVEN